MYSINLENNFIFVHVPKTGGTSVKKYLKENIKDSQNHLFQLPKVYEKSVKQFISEDKFVYKNTRMEGYHAFLDHYKDINLYGLPVANIPKENTDKYFKFSIIRNPWDRMVSLYFWKTKNKFGNRKNVSPLHYAGSKNVNSFHSWLKLEVDYLVKNNLQHYRYRNGNKIGMGIKNIELFNYVDFFNPEELNKILKFENLQEDFNHVCKELNINQGALSYEHKTKHNEYREYYVKETIDIVKDIFRRDIEKFSYEF